MKESEIILADEPTGALDEENGRNVMKVLKELNESGKTVIIVTHDNKIAGQCNRIIEIRDGEIVDENNEINYLKEVLYCFLLLCFLICAC